MAARHVIGASPLRDFLVFAAGMAVAVAAVMAATAYAARHLTRDDGGDDT